MKDKDDLFICFNEPGNVRSNSRNVVLHAWVVGGLVACRREGGCFGVEAVGLEMAGDLFVNRRAFPEAGYEEDGRSHGSGEP